MNIEDLKIDDIFIINEKDLAPKRVIKNCAKRLFFYYVLSGQTGSFIKRNYPEIILY